RSTSVASLTPHFGQFSAVPSKRWPHFLQYMRALCYTGPPLNNLPLWRHVVEPDEIDVLALTMLRDFEEVQHAKETRLASELRSNVRETDRLDRIVFDFALVHTIPCAGLDVRMHPYPDAARDVAGTNALPLSLGESQGEQ